MNKQGIIKAGFIILLLAGVLLSIGLIAGASSEGTTSTTISAGQNIDTPRLGKLETDKTFVKLTSNTGDLFHGESEFDFYSPIDVPSDRIRLSFNILDGSVQAYGIYLWSKWDETNKLCERVIDKEQTCDNGLENHTLIDCSTYKEVCNDVKTSKEGYIKSATIPAGNQKIKIRVDYLPNKGRIKLDWIPSTSLTSFETGLSKDVYLSKDDWAWYNSSWNYKKQLNITGGAAALSAFPTFVKVTKNANMLANCGDIRFVNSTETGELPYEIDYCNSSDAGFWVLNNLSTGTNTIYVYYGNAGATTTSNGNAVFSPSARLVYHLSETSGTTIVNSIAGVNGTISNADMIVPGVFGNANNYTASTSRFSNLSTAATGSNTDSITAWFQFESASDWGLFDARGGVGTGYTYFSSGTFGDSSGKYYVDKVKQDTYDTAHPAQWQFFSLVGDTISAPVDIILGAQNALTGANFRGKIDNFVLWKGTISSAWLNRTYDNADFTKFTFGAEAANSATMTTALISPANASTNITGTSIPFSCNVTTSGNLANTTLMIWNGGLVYNSTLSKSGTFNQSSFAYTFTTNNTYQWNCLSRDVDNTLSQASSNRTLTINNPAITLFATLLNPINNTNSTTNSLDFSCNVSSTSAQNISNITFSVWNITGSLLHSQYYTYNGSQNYTSANFSYDLPVKDASYLWGCSAKDTASNNATAVNRTINIGIPPSISMSLVDGTVFGRTQFQNTVPVGITYTITEDNLNVSSWRMLSPSGGVVVENNATTALTGTIQANLSAYGVYSLNITAEDSWFNNVSVSKSFSVVLVAGQAGGAAAGLDASLVANNSTATTTPASPKPVFITLGIIIILALIFGAITGRK